MHQYKFKVPESKRVRYLVHTDCKNEADDQFTVAHILMTPKLEVKGLIGAHFNKNFQNIPDGKTAEASVDEINKILKLMDLEGAYPVVEGAGLPLVDEFTPRDSAGARMIIEEAMKDDPKKLFIGLQGSLTDLASAIIMKPDICDRMTAIWIGGGIYPEGGREFNLTQDLIAANVVFKSSMPLWQVPMNIYKTFSISLAQLEYRVLPCGKLGEYLFQELTELNEKIGKEAPDFTWPHGELWGLGDSGVVAALMQEEQRTDLYDMIPAPTFDPETAKYVYEGSENRRKIRVYKQMDVLLTMEDFFCKLALNFGK